jgi:hypothetical protein
MAIRKRIRQHAGLHEARISSLSHQRPQLRAAPTSSEILVADQPIVGLDLDAMDPVFDRIVLPDRDKTEPLDPRRVTQRPWSGKGVRHLLSQPEGDGYWDFFKPSDHLLISVTDATYRESTWVTVKGSRYFKLRLLLSGELTTARGGTLLRGPQALLVLSPEFSSGGYYIAAGQPTRMIVLHFLAVTRSLPRCWYALGPRPSEWRNVLSILDMNCPAYFDRLILSR